MASLDICDIRERLGHSLSIYTEETSLGAAATKFRRFHFRTGAAGIQNAAQDRPTIPSKVPLTHNG